MIGQKQKYTEPYNQFSEHDESTLEKLVSNVNGFMCEIGCWTGHSTSILARRAKEIGSYVYVIDNFEGNEGTPLAEFSKDNSVRDMFIENMKEEDLFNNIILHTADSNKAYQYLSDKKFSLIFIDAGHKYSEVKSDLTHYLPKLITGGIICGHDYESDTYDEAHVEEDYVNGKHHGVIKSVNEILGKVEHEGRMWWKKYDD